MSSTSITVLALKSPINAGSTAKYLVSNPVEKSDGFIIILKLVPHGGEAFCLCEHDGSPTYSIVPLKIAFDSWPSTGPPDMAMKMVRDK